MVHGSHFSKCGIYAMAAQDNSTRDTDLIKSLITVTFISLLIFQLKYLLPYVSALNACALPLLHITQKHWRSGIPLCYSQRQQKQKANSSHALPSQGLTEPLWDRGDRGGDLLFPWTHSSAQVPPSCVRAGVSRSWN